MPGEFERNNASPDPAQLSTTYGFRRDVAENERWLVCEAGTDMSELRLTNGPDNLPRAGSVRLALPCIRARNWDLRCGEPSERMERKARELGRAWTRRLELAD